ncbi:NAD-binding protein [Chloroflexota bacterium]
MKNSFEYSSMVIGSAPSEPSLRKRLRRLLRDYKWPLIGFIWLVAIALGYIGFSKYFLASGVTSSPGKTFYHTLQLFTLESGWVSPVGWELQLARFLAPAVAGYTALQALAIILREQFQLFRLRFLKDHTIICGLGRKGLLLCKGFLEREERVVVIEQNRNNSRLGQCKKLGATVLIGNATDPELLQRARIQKAKYLISVCGNDGANAEVAVNARQLVWNRQGKALSCLIHIFDLQLRNLLREREIMMGRLDAFTLGFFNVFESGARVLLEEYPPFNKTGEELSSRPHIVVVGVGRMGESLVVNVARNWRDRDNTSGERLRITLIDREANKKRESLCFRYPQLERVCELVPVQMDIKSPEFERAEFLFDGQGCCDVMMIYICLDDDSNALSAALTLRQRVRALEIPIVLRTTHDAGLATLLRGEKDKRGSFVSVHAFGLLDRTCTPDLALRSTYEILAHAIHEEYLRHMKEQGSTPQTNPSMVPWEELPESLKESNRAQAEHIRVKLETIGCDIAMSTDWDAPLFEFSPKEVELLAEMEHERWVDERLRKGWKYGPTKDDKVKIHPCLAPWNELPDDEKDKDRDAVRHLPAFLVKVRFQVYRMRKK